MRGNFIMLYFAVMEQETKKYKKTKWSFHAFNIGDEKVMKKHELANFRSSLSVWNKSNDKIEYDYMDLAGDKVKVWRTA